MSDLLLKGMINGMEQMGATCVKNNTSEIYFTISKGGELDNDEKLKNAAEIWMKAFGLTLRIKKI